jgi:hypothetical protein
MNRKKQRNRNCDILRRQRRKRLLVEYKGGKCIDCVAQGREGVFPSCCFDFDHRNPKDKSFNIGMNLDKPVRELIVESDKCDLVCSNCHRIRTVGNDAVLQKLKAGIRFARSNDTGLLAAIATGRVTMEIGVDDDYGKLTIKGPLFE